MDLPKPTACLTVDEIEIGMSAEKTYSIDYQDTIKFSEISGDWNPAHHDEEYAAGSIFQQRVAHGMVSAAQFSGLFGMVLPGLGTLWIKNEVEFLRPVFFGQKYRAVVTVIGIDRESNTVTLSTECFNQQAERIVTGTSVVKPIPAKVKARLLEQNLLQDGAA